MKNIHSPAWSYFFCVETERWIFGFHSVLTQIEILASSSVIIFQSTDRWERLMGGIECVREGWYWEELHSSAVWTISVRVVLEREVTIFMKVVLEREVAIFCESCAWKRGKWWLRSEGACVTSWEVGGVGRVMTDEWREGGVGHVVWINEKMRGGSCLSIRQLIKLLLLLLYYGKPNFH